MKKKMLNLIIALVFLTGISLMLYPAVSDYWNSFHRSGVIADYNGQVKKLDKADYDKILSDAKEYNKSLVGKNNRYKLSESEQKEYENLLNISGDGMMGYVEIPGIQCTLPIYHGIDEEILQVAVGHLPGTSLPVGGKSSHCVITGHSGLPSAKLFTNLDRVTEGDIFTLHIADEVYTYQVDRIRIVLPEELEDLKIEKGKDYCTLVTCTPYGINTHRLLVRGVRNDDLANAGATQITTEAFQIDPVLVVPVVAVPLLLILIVYYFLRNSNKRR